MTLNYLVSVCVKNVTQVIATFFKKKLKLLQTNQFFIKKNIVF